MDQSIHNTKILRHVVASSAKSEVEENLHTGKKSVTLHISLNELGFTQPPTPTKTDNSAAEGVFNATDKKKVQGNGYAILLDEGQGKTKIFL